MALGALGSFVAGLPTKRAEIAIEDAFDTYIYTGNGGTQTISTGVNYTDGDHLVWIKNRSAQGAHVLTDTVRTATNILASNTTAAESADADTLTSFNDGSFDLGDDVNLNTSGEDYVSWNFKVYDRFFYMEEASHTNGSDTTVDLSSLNTVGMVTVKRVDSTSDWYTHHRSLGAGNLVYLNLQDAQTADSSIDVSGTDLTIDSALPTGTYMVYAWAHDPLGPSGDGSDGLVECGIYTGNGSNDGPEIDLGWEPQFLIFKNITNADRWIMHDNKRGWVTNGDDNYLEVQTSGNESTAELSRILPNGFKLNNNASLVNANADDYIYLAIRRGPMKQPESGSDVFAASFGNGSASGNVGSFSSGWPVDFAFLTDVANGLERRVSARLINNFFFNLNDTSGESNNTAYSTVFENGWADSNGFDSDYVSWMFRRYPKVFDVVTYTGNGATSRTILHNLNAVPEMMVVSKRAIPRHITYHKDFDKDNDGNPETDYLELINSQTGSDDSTIWNDTKPTKDDFTIGGNSDVNESGKEYIVFLFSTLSGISKLGGYSGTGSAQTIDCGFSNGAALVWIKRVDTNGDWILWDSTRGIVSGNEPYLETNTSNAQVTGNDYIDPESSGFTINGGFADVNANGGEYVFLAIAA
jgi:hypothetical protein